MKNSMNSVNELIKKQPWAVLGGVFVVGLLVGWMALGWGLFPVQYVNGGISQLRPDLKQDYVRLVASAYVLNPDAELASQRISQLGAEAGQVLSDTLQAATGEEAVHLSQLKFVLEQSGALKPAKVKPAAPSLIEQLRLPLLLCGVVLIVGAVGAFFVMRAGGLSSARKPGGKPRTAASQAESALAAADAGGEFAPAAPAIATPTGEAPVARFMTTYALGEDMYDDSFSVEAPDGSFLGECGVGISETVGVGDPKKVTAFEVWLFDKNDIRTVTKVLMSEHAFRDEAIKSRLAAKGEPVQVNAGDMVQLDTASLIVTARVVDMAYGGGALPPGSFFERLTIELAAYKKPAA